MTKTTRASTTDLVLAEGTAKRLKWLRLRMGLKQFEIAEAIGASPSRWNHWEKGFRLIPLVDAVKLCEWADVSLDWIYRGVDKR